ARGCGRSGWSCRGRCAPRFRAHGGGPAGSSRPRVATRRCYPRRAMANIKSQIKRNRQNEKRRLRNKAARSEIKTRVKKAVEAAEQGADDSVEALRTAVKRIDKAASKGIIHKNQAANRKSRLMRRMAKQSSPDA